MRRYYLREVCQGETLIYLNISTCPPSKLSPTRLLIYGVRLNVEKAPELRSFFCCF